MLNPTLEKSFVEQIGKPNWKESKNAPVPDEIINAWEKGIIKGVNDAFNAMGKIAINKFIENLKKATNLTEDIAKKINSETKLNCKKIFMRSTQVVHFDFLFIVDNKRYLTDDRNKAYKIIDDIKKENINDTFNFNYSFMPYSDNINVELLNADGYCFSYEKK